MKPGVPSVMHSGAPWMPKWHVEASDYLTWVWRLHNAWVGFLGLRLALALDLALALRLNWFVCMYDLKITSGAWIWYPDELTLTKLPWLLSQEHLPSPPRPLDRVWAQSC